MDPLTHLAAGILIAQAIEPVQTSISGVLAAAVASQLPDLDFLTKKIGSSTLFLKLHHTIGHSLLVLLPISLALSWLIALFIEGSHLSTLFLIMFLTLVSHLFLDILIHGSGMSLFWPLSQRKISLSLVMGPNPLTASAQCYRRSLVVCTKCQLHGSLYMFVFYLIIGGGLLSLVFQAHARSIALLVLGLLVVYLLYCYSQKTRARRIWENEHAPDEGETVHVVPGGYQPWLWFVLNKRRDTCLTAYIDTRSGSISPPHMYRNTPDNSFIQKSRETRTVRDFLYEAMVPQVESIDRGDRIEVHWRELAYAFSADVDLYMAKVVLTPTGQVISHEFRERW
ncbi:metal-dependent hydrolase [bacterium]|nr:metal-dependent hydrolase [bacterium]